MLYEEMRTKDIFKYLKKLSEIETRSIIKKPSLEIDGNKINQDDLNSLLEFEQISRLLKKIKDKKNTILEIGAGSGRTAKTVISIMNDVKYVIADIPPAINLCFENMKRYFPEKKIVTAFEANNKNDLKNILNQNDIVFIFPHQLKLFE